MAQARKANGFAIEGGHHVVAQLLLTPIFLPRMRQLLGFLPGFHGQIGAVLVGTRIRVDGKDGVNIGVRGYGQYKARGAK